MSTMFARARKAMLILTPQENAILRFIQALIVSFVVACLAVIITTLQAGQVISGDVWLSALLAGAFTVCETLTTLFRSLGNQQATMVSSLAGAAIEAEYESHNKQPGQSLDTIQKAANTEVNAELDQAYEILGQQHHAEGTPPAS